MDILLTHGYFLREDESEKRIMKPYPTLGILYLSSYLKSKGFDVSIYDTTFKSKSDFQLYIDNVRPKVIGIYVNLMTKLNVLDQIKYCKSKDCTVIVGGPDVPEYAEEYVEYGADIAVLGEGEETVAELLPHLLNNNFSALQNVLGIVFRDEYGTIRRTSNRPLIQDIDMLPFPDRNSIDLFEYINTWRTYHGMGSVSLICARGCPYTCTWCSRSIFGETHRRRSVASVIKEIELIIEKYKPDMLWFADDVFAINHKWFYEFYNEMKKRNLRIPFECISRADRLNEDILQKMADLGCFRIWYGSESGSQRILDLMQRRVTVEEIRAVTRLAQKYGIQAGLFVMLGYPGEEIEDIEATVEHLKETQPDIFLHTTAYPIKGTPFYDEVRDLIYSNDGWNCLTDRNLKIHGRYSDTFYWFAIRYLANEVGYHSLRRKNKAAFSKLASMYVKSKVARFGMELTKHNAA